MTPKPTGGVRPLGQINLLIIPIMPPGSAHTLHLPWFLLQSHSWGLAVQGRWKDDHHGEGLQRCLQERQQLQLLHFLQLPWLSCVFYLKRLPWKEATVFCCKQLCFWGEELPRPASLPKIKHGKQGPRSLELRRNKPVCRGYSWGNTLLYNVNNS